MWFMYSHRIICSYAALAAAIAVGLLSFFRQNVTANLLILIAQFLLYSLTMAGLGEFVLAVLKLMKSYDKSISPLHAGGANEDLRKS